MQAEQNNNSHYEQILEAQKEIRQLLVKLNQSMKYLSTSTSDQQNWNKVLLGALEVFDQMQVKLGIHFAFKEEGGYLSEALTIAPWFSKNAIRLEKQHLAFLEELSDIRQKTLEFDTATCNFSILEKIINNFISELHKHESEVNYLMQSVYLDDFGTSG